MIPRRLHITIRGAVQGVGFRPFIFRLARQLGLTGWVLNSGGGVQIEVEGPVSILESFLLRVPQEKPPLSFLQSMEHVYLDPAGYSSFEIRESSRDEAPSSFVLPDIATCPECLLEMFNPADRRYLYPFTNCTNCGPRFTIMTALPYDRPNTTMAGFPMCSACRREYEDPSDRRFHAQPTACPACGPHLELWDKLGTVLARDHDAILGTAAGILAGKIVAVKGLGGFHLMADAEEDFPVRTLRERKVREEKPFALLYPGLDRVRKDCSLTQAEERLLLSPEAPIVLVRKSSPRIAEIVAPRNPRLGIMLPSTPLHHILMHEIGKPVVATSGNLSDEPICTDEREALHRLGGIADLFLIHNRPIRRHADDSIVRMMAGRELMLRRARGYAPLPVEIVQPIVNGSSVLAVGAHLKNTIAISVGHNIFLSQHIGDLETSEAYDAFTNVIESFRTLYGMSPMRIAADMHEGYLSTQYARSQDTETVILQHHYTHIASCMAENQLTGDVLGIAWDGTGYGPDGTIWGGEFLLADECTFRRFATFRPFRLPGGEVAVKQPRRAAFGLLYELRGMGMHTLGRLPTMESIPEREVGLFTTMLQKGFNSPLTSSAGRLFDAVSSLLGIRQKVSFEGQAAMELEWAAEDEETNDTFPFDFREGTSSSPAIVDWGPLVEAILTEREKGTRVGQISAMFHNTLAAIILMAAQRAGRERIVLSGGCFQNARLTERSIGLLEKNGFRPYWHQRIPPNDGGIALGQAAVCLRSRQDAAFDHKGKDGSHVPGNTR